MDWISKSLFLWHGKKNRIFLVITRLFMNADMGNNNFSSSFPHFDLSTSGKLTKGDIAG